MHDRYKVATVFVNHYSDYTYVHLSKSTTQVETLEAKSAFEHLAASFNVCIMNYHANNGQFAKHPFQDAVQDANQHITFCGVTRMG